MFGGSIEIMASLRQNLFKTTFFAAKMSLITTVIELSLSGPVIDRASRCISFDQRDYMEYKQ